MNTLIRYDLRKKKLSGIAAVISGVIALASIILIFVVNPSASSLGEYEFFVIIMTVAGLYICTPLALYFIYNYIFAAVYLRRLKNNGFEVPKNRRSYRCLEDLPRTGEPVTNRYAGDSRLSGILTLIAYAALISADIWYNRRWAGFETDSNEMTVFLVIIHTSVCAVAFFIFIHQRNTDRYIDIVDLKDGRKPRVFIVSACLIIIILTVAGCIAVTLADSMTKYIYKSKYGYYEKTVNDLYEGATMDLSSECLTEGLTDEAPDLSFEEVEGAKYYVIYMIDMDDSNRVLWYAEVTSTELEEGNDAGIYEAPIPHGVADPHECVLFVFAMEDEPCSTSEVTVGGTNASLEYYYYAILNVKDNGSIPVYGNVISYGYLRGYS